jgi:hypothetical protein
LKKRLIYFQQLSVKGVILVRPEDFIREKHNNKVDFAILDHLYLLRNHDPRSARELTSALRHQYSCDNGHTFTLSAISERVCPKCHREASLLLAKQDSAERTVRNHLDKLKLDGDIQKTTRDPTGQSGRSPDVYHLSDDFTTQLDFYLNVKELKLGVQLDAIIAPTTQKDADIRAFEERAKNGELEAIGNLVRLLDTEKDEKARFNIVMALGRIGGPQAIKALRTARTNDPCEKVRSIASTALKEKNKRNTFS